VVASKCTSIPEVLEMEEALFDPLDAHSMASRLLQLHVEQEYRGRLLSHARTQPGRFSWKQSGKVAVDALEARHQQLIADGWQQLSRAALPSCASMLNRVNMLVPDVQPKFEDLENFRECYEFNLG
jgi:hypothetical protein